MQQYINDGSIVPDQIVDGLDELLLNELAEAHNSNEGDYDFEEDVNPFADDFGSGGWQQGKRVNTTHVGLEPPAKKLSMPSPSIL